MIVSALFTYNDWEYLDQTIESFKWFPDILYIIEGSWQSAQQYNQSPPRSGPETYAIIDKHVDNKKVFLVQANEARERNQRQIGLDLAKKHGADWFWMLDSDEVYTKSVLQGMKAILNRAPADCHGFRLRSYNFLNSFKQWYDGNYWRIYRPIPEAQFIMDNDVSFGNKAVSVQTMPEHLRFYHYNYVKQNSAQFWRKMSYQAEQDPSFNTRLLPHYGHDGKKYTIPSDIPVYNFNSFHPRIMANHPYFRENIYGDGDLRYGKE